MILLGCILAGIGLLVIVAMLMLPMPGWMLDLGLVVALGTSVMILLTTVNAATQRLPARAVLREASFSARVGQRVNEEALRSFLSRAGFSPVATVTVEVPRAGGVTR